MRMSTDKQEHSIDSQKRLIQTYVKQHGYCIIKDYIDEGISGRNAEKRPQFLQMIDDSKNGEFQYVIIYDSSRFARNLEQSLVYKSILKKNMVVLVSITEPVLDDDTSLITDALFGAMNEMYSRKLSKNVKRGMEQKALRGEFCGKEPFGYDYHVEKKMLIPNEQESPIVSYIMSETLIGRTSYSIALNLKKNNIKSKKGTFLDCRRIDYIIRNPVYKGYVRWGTDGKQIIQKSTHQPLITEKQFEQIQNQLQKRVQQKPLHSKPSELCSHWLSGMIYCSECNCTYTYVKARKDENKKARFRCSGQSRGRCSSGISFTAETLETQIYLILQELIAEDGFIYAKNSQSNIPKIIDFSAEIKKSNASLSRAKAAFLAGFDTLDEYGKNKNLFLAEIEKFTNLQTQYSKAKENIHQETSPITNLIDFLKSDVTIEIKKTALHAIVEKIVIEKQTKTIKLYTFT